MARTTWPGMAAPGRAFGLTRAAAPAVGPTRTAAAGTMLGTTPSARRSGPWWRTPTSCGSRRCCTNLSASGGTRARRRALGIDHRTVASSVRQGLSRRVREALERSLVEKDGDARDRLEEEFAGFRERFEALAGELRDGLSTVQGQMETLGEQQAGRMRRLEGRVAQVEGELSRRVSVGTGAAASVGRRAAASAATRRRHPDLVTKDPADDDEKVLRRRLAVGGGMAQAVGRPSGPGQGPGLGVPAGAGSGLGGRHAGGPRPDPAAGDGTAPGPGPGRAVELAGQRRWWTFAGGGPG